MNRFAIAFACVTAACTAPSMARAQDATGPKNDKTIVQLAQEAGQFQTLVAAVKAAGLAEALSGKGPFTVFAPNDKAFAKLGKYAIADLLRPENKQKLASILKFHVVSGNLPASKVVAADSVMTLQGGKLGVQVSDAGVKIGAANVLATDIFGSNGVIHVIDSVLMPDLRPNLVEAADSAGMFKTLIAAAKAAGLAETLASGGPFTIFAPTDEAFAKLGEETIADLLRLENKKKLASILKHHVVAGRVPSAKAVKLTSATTLDGSSLKLKFDGQGLHVGEAKVIQADVDASNGVIHVIDAVLLPQPRPNLVEAADAAGQFKTLIAAAKAAGLADTLANGGPFTIFAPTDEAFAKLGSDTITELLRPENKQKLASILKHHVIVGTVVAAKAVKLTSAKTLNTTMLSLKFDGKTLHVDGAKVIQADVDASNGVIHVIDSVLIPKS